MGSFEWPWERENSDKQLQDILLDKDLTRRIGAQDKTSRVADRFLEGLHQQIGTSLSAAVNIASLAPQLRTMANGAKTLGGQLHSASETIASTSEEVSTTLEAELVPGAKDMARLSRNVAQSVRQCETGSNQVLSHIGAISHSERDLESAIVELQDQLTEVTQVIGVIAEISKQTNLLSLNAAIEAARAGTHGLGFAVVAEEVRRLALHATESTNQVTEIIERFRTDMSQLTKAGTQMQQAVSAGEAGIKDMRTDLATARSSMDELDGRVSAIAAGTEQIGVAVGAMNEDIHTVSRVAGELLSNATQIGNQGQEVHEQSDRLLEGLGGFQLELHNQARDAIVQLALNSALISGSANQAEQALERALNRDPRCELLYLVAANGRQITRNIFAPDLGDLDGEQARNRDWSQRHWFKAVLETGKTHLTEVYRSAATDAFCFTVAVPVFDSQGRLVRVLGADLRLSTLT